MNYIELDKSQGLGVWHAEDYLDLIWKHRGSAKWRPLDIPGIDYVPYENVLPNKARFEAEYAALPSGQRVELTGELLKEAKTWGLPAEWPDKTDFVRRVRECRKNPGAINGRGGRLMQAIIAIERRLRTSDNHKTIEAFVAQNRKEVAYNASVLSRAVLRGGLPFLPNVRLDDAVYHGIIHPKATSAAPPTVTPVLRPKVEAETRHDGLHSKEAPDVRFKRGNAESSLRFSIAKKDNYFEPSHRIFAKLVAERQWRRQETREEGLLQRAWRFLFGA